ncbi:uncharacterized protein B4U80_14986 [Leptotrombidium deliense]|uniref:Uncharacterized protein n=1 Tax=Leptotrombidium deliense TaxID=299467 RepID=A0A443RVH3_9ACAR|nr:uncharacterized protein B4U80_14986 [Leptotrombidium deliense]
MIACKIIEKANHTTIARTFENAVRKLLSGEDFQDRVQLVVTDAAEYMKAAFRSLRKLASIIADGSESSATLRQQLLYVHNFRFLPDVIQSLEAKGLSVDEQLQILKSCEDRLKNFKNPLDGLQIRMKNNDGLAKLLEARKNVEFAKNLFYAPLTSVEVERSFSQFKSFFRDNRHRFKEDNLEHFVMLNFNGTS